nr:hypothetical protein [uncultured Niameybacter sp.]
MNKVGQKLKSLKGETIAEALMASLLGGIGLLILATMIRVSHGMIDNSNDIINVFYEEVNLLEKQSIVPKEGTVTITDLNNTKAEIHVKVYKTNKNELAMYTHKYNEADSNDKK